MPKIIQVPDDTDTSGVQNSPKPKPGGAKLIQVPLNTEPQNPQQTQSNDIPRFSDVPQGQFNNGQDPRFEDALSYLPMVGGMAAGLPGAAAGAFARQALTKDPSLGQAGEDITTQGLIPAGIGKVLESIPSGFLSKIAAKLANSNNPTVSEGLASKMERFLSSNTDPIDVGAENTKVQAASINQPSKVQQMLLNRPRGINPVNETSDQTYGQIFDTALSDVQHVRNYKLATGDDGTIEQLALNKAGAKGYSGADRFDPDAVLKELNGPNKDIYDEAINPETRQRFEDFLNKASDFQPDTQGNSMMRYVKHRLVFDLAAYGIGHEVGGPIVGGSALILGNQAVSKLMQSDFLGKLALQSLDTPTSSQVSPVLTKAILTGLRGTVAYIQSPDGKEQPVQISNDGQIQSIKTSQ